VRWVLVLGTGRQRCLPNEVLLLAEALGRALAEQGFGLVVGGWPGTWWRRAMPRRWKPKSCLCRLPGPLEHRAQLAVWDDHRLQAGDVYKDRIGESIARAPVAIFIVSSAFFVSIFILTEELARLLEKTKKAPADCCGC
jgi:hypothetical protein